MPGTGCWFSLNRHQYSSIQTLVGRRLEPAFDDCEIAGNGKHHRFSLTHNHEVIEPWVSALAKNCGESRGAWHDRVFRLARERADLSTLPSTVLRIGTAQGHGFALRAKAYALSRVQSHCARFSDASHAHRGSSDNPADGTVRATSSTITFWPGTILIVGFAITLWVWL